MGHFSDFRSLRLLIADGELTNGECIQLAVQLLERCTKAPCTKLGELFDRCLDGLQLIAAAVGKAASMD